MHKNNRHFRGYDLKKLIQVVPELKTFVFENKYNNKTIDFANSEAVKVLNKALLKLYYKIDYWDFSDENLCPPIPGRVDYIHHLNDLLFKSNIQENVSVLDIGTGATCIYPLLGSAIYDWHFIASDIDLKSLKNAKKIIEKNALNESVILRFQKDKSKILTGVFDSTEKINASMCNPPFFKSRAAAVEASARKWKGLKREKDSGFRNFSGTANELWYNGGEKAFLHNYLYESSLFKTNCFWYTSLVSSKEEIRPMKVSLKKLGATEVIVIPMKQGNKISRIVAWTFLNAKQQKNWITD